MKGDKGRETRHSGRHMKRDKAQTTQERRTPPLRKKQMKGDKSRETRHRQDRRGGHHHSGRHMMGDK